MQVVILCGGRGTRMGRESEVIPKPMVLIGDRPILWHIMRHYSTHNFNKFILCTGYRGDMIKNYFLSYRQNTGDLEIDLATGKQTLLGAPEGKLDWRVRIQDTGVETLTGARIKAALKYIEEDCFLATYGDGVANVDIGKLVKHHNDSGKLATVTAVRPSSRFGELALEGNMVRSFNEKPQIGEGWINGGFLVIDKKAFEHVRDTDNIALESGVLEALAEQGELSVYRHEGFWQCMDTYREQCLLEDMWKAKNAPWKTW